MYCNNHLFWEYKNPIEAEVYDDYGEVMFLEEIYGDNMPGIELKVV